MRSQCCTPPPRSTAAASARVAKNRQDKSISTYSGRLQQFLAGSFNLLLTCRPRTFNAVDSKSSHGSRRDAAAHAGG